MFNIKKCQEQVSKNKLLVIKMNWFIETFWSILIFDPYFYYVAIISNIYLYLIPETNFKKYIILAYDSNFLFIFIFSRLDSTSYNHEFKEILNIFDFCSCCKCLSCNNSVTCRAELVKKIGIVVAFLATHSGLTRWQNFPQNFEKEYNP